MNLFILDKNPVIAAQMNCNSHVCKIILEAAQMLCLGHWANGGEAEYHAKSQINNHVSKWVRANKANYRWTVEHGLALCDEYTFRYGKVHKSRRIIEWCRDNEPNIPNGVQMPFPMAVASDCYDNDIIKAYHFYYVFFKSNFAVWSVRPTPQWYVELKELVDNQYWSI